jgi:hypothetical protein
MFFLSRSAGLNVSFPPEPSSPRPSAERHFPHAKSRWNSHEMKLMNPPIKPMNSWCNNRLTMVGLAHDLKPFDKKGRWPCKLKAQHIDVLEFSATRHAWQFETLKPPLESLKRLSIRWPKLTFLLDHDQPDVRVKGLTKARAGRLENHQVRYHR